MQISKIKNCIILLLIPIVTALVAIGIGRYEIGFGDVITILTSPITGNVGETSEIAQNLVLNSRTPRVLTALLVGLGLSVSGVVMQSIFSNPLATPDTIGVSSGASFGAVLGIMAGGNMLFIQTTAFVFGIIATFLTIGLSKISKNSGIVMIVLSGMVVSSFFSALISLLKTVADTDSQLPSIVYWLMGSMISSSYERLYLGGICIIIGSAIIFITRWRLNIINLSDDEATSLGVSVKKYRMLMLIATTLITAASVSMCGQIGWIGLLIPHLCRMIVGSNNLYIVPISLSFGATFMVIVDTIARAMTSTEIPLSILTALIGTPFFAFLIWTSGGKW